MYMCGAREGEKERKNRHTDREKEREGEKRRKNSTY